MRRAAQWKAAYAGEPGAQKGAHMRHYQEFENHTLLGLRGKHVVTIGGGTGPFGVLSSLKHYPCAITAIVTMADSGGSSRRLMDEFGQLPFGDLRQALIALSRNGVLWRDVFTYRFGKSTRVNGSSSNGHTAPARANSNANANAIDPGAASVTSSALSSQSTPAASGAVATALASVAQQMGEQAGVSGHSLGNLIISALQDINNGNLLHAIADAQELLDTAGTVLPVTLTQTTLCAEMEDGEIICGETDIDTRGNRNPEPLAPIKRLFLEHPTPPCDDALRAIRRADVIIIGPGDLYTSVLPNLLVEGVAEAIRASEAQTVYVTNLMTKHGETDGFRASNFAEEIHHYLGDRVDRVILHDGSFPDHLLDGYAAQSQYPVEADVEEVRRIVPEVVVDQLLAVYHDHYVRHDADRLVRAIFMSPDLLA